MRADPTQPVKTDHIIFSTTARYRTTGATGGAGGSGGEGVEIGGEGAAR